MSTETDQLQVPLTEIELAELLDAVRTGLLRIDVMKVRRLAFERDRLRAALSPFAAVGVPDTWSDGCIVSWEEEWGPAPAYEASASIGYLSLACKGAPTVADYRRARAALAKENPRD